MDFSNFNSLLINGIIEKWLLFVIALVVVVAHEIYYIYSKGKTKRENEEIRIRGNFLILGLAIVFLLIANKTVPMAVDLFNEEYVEVHGEYSLDEHWYKSQIDRWVHIVTDEGETFGIKFPGYLHGEEKLFPSGEFTGTVWYAKNSMTIVRFILDEPTDDN